MVAARLNQRNNDLLVVRLGRELMVPQLRRDVENPLVVRNPRIPRQCAPPARPQDLSPDGSILWHVHHPMRRRVRRAAPQVAGLEYADVHAMSPRPIR